MQEIFTNIPQESQIPAQQGLNLTAFFRTIKRKALPIAGIVGVVTAVSLYHSSALPTYTGDFQILVEPVTSEAKSSEPSTLTSSSKGVMVDSLEMDYSTVITILQSPGILSSIVKQVQIKYPSFSLEQLKTNLKIERLNLSEVDLTEQTKIIQISYKESDPELVQLVLKETAKKYLSYSLEDRKTKIGQGVEFIEEQLPEINTRVSTLQTKLQKLQEANSFIDPDLKGEDILKQVREIKVQQIETQNQLQKLRTLKDSLQKQLKITPEEAIIVSTLNDDTNYQDLLSKFKTVESELSLETARFTVNSPNLQLLQDKRQELLSLLGQESKRILGANLTIKAQSYPSIELQSSVTKEMVQQLVETNNQIKLLETQYNALAASSQKLELQALQFPKVSRQYTEIKQELTINTRTLDQLLTQRDALRIELAQSQIPWEIVSAPQILRDSTGNPTPLPQDSDKKLIMSLIGSLALGIGTTFFLEKSRDIFYTVEDIKEKIKLPLLGSIPGNSDLRFLDAFDSLYANLKFRFSEPAIRSFVVTSAEDEDGKSTVALKLAEISAAMGNKVLLVDANLRSPSLHARLSLGNKKGLSDLLVDPIDLNYNDFIERDLQHSNLFVLTSGQMSPDSTRMLASNRMKSLNREFQEAFDLVIYDTPAAIKHMDTSFLAAHTDGILMVVAIGKTPKSSFMKALNQIENFKLQNLGIVTTQILEDRSED
jgi:capsular exopolysaccharide synthesis family protein